MGERALAVALTVVALAAACQQPQAAPAQRVIGADAARGRQLIGKYGCGACHTVPGVRGADGLVGPPLVDFAQRGYIAGRLPNTPEHLVRWIVNPQSVDSLTAMPALGVTVPDARDIAAYLYTLERGGLGPPHLLPESWLD
ncbi:MAG: c-type cytochrome [Gemmatimonadota bacterium]